MPGTWRQSPRKSSRPAWPNNNHIGISVSSYNDVNSSEYRYILSKSCIFQFPSYTAHSQGCHPNKNLHVSKKKMFLPLSRQLKPYCQGHGWQAENSLDNRPHIVLGRVSLFQPQSIQPYTAPWVNV